MLRGRGTLEVRPSNNPYFQPVSADIGKNLDNSNVEWKVSGTIPQFTSTKHSVDGNFAFLYTRESDRIGSKVPKPQLTETKMLSKTEFLKQRRERALASAGEMAVTGSTSPNGFDPESSGNLSVPQTPASPAREEGATFKVDPNAYLKVYKHVSKEEDPRYITSSVCLAQVSFIASLILFIYFPSFFYRMILVASHLQSPLLSAKDILFSKTFPNRFKTLSLRIQV